jgi:SAM-dependent methyltransferase
MLAIALRKRDAVGLTDTRLKLVRGDILKLNLDRRFDWVTIFFNTFLGFTTLSEQDRLLRNILRHLKPRGKLWLDLFHPDLSLLAEPRSLAMESRLFHVPEHDRPVMRTVDVRRDPSRQIQEVTYRYKWFDPGGRERRGTTTFEMTYIMPRELTLLL